MIFRQIRQYTHQQCKGRLGLSDKYSWLIFSVSQGRTTACVYGVQPPSCFRAPEHCVKAQRMHCNTPAPISQPPTPPSSPTTRGDEERPDLTSTEDTVVTICSSCAGEFRTLLTQLHTVSRHHVFASLYTVYTVCIHLSPDFSDLITMTYRIQAGTMSESPDFKATADTLLCLCR